MSKYFLAMDIGGTKTTGALFSEDGKLVDDYTYVRKSQTFKGEEVVYQNTKKVLDKVIEHFGIDMNDVLGIGVGSPGPLNTEQGIVIHAPLMGWKNFPIAKRLQKDFEKPVKIDNDGNLGALAEQRCGVAVGKQNVMYITVSTGCGGGLVINGEIYHGKNDGAGEVGHMSIQPEGKECPCGAKGCFEMYASGTAINKKVREDIRNGQKSMLWEESEHNVECIDGAMIMRAASKGDPYALAVYREEGYYLGVALSNVFNLFSPEVLVLGGGVTKAKKYFHEEMMKGIEERCIQKPREEQIRYSVMNDKVVLYGAYCLISDFIKREKKTNQRA